MERANIEYLLGIFRELTTEMPDEMLYRDNGDSIELRSLGSMVESQTAAGTRAEGQIDQTWSLISSRVYQAA